MAARRALTLMGAFSSIYHPVGIPMLVRGSARPGPHDRDQRARRQSRRRARRGDDGAARQVRRLARGVRRARARRVRLRRRVRAASRRTSRCRPRGARADAGRAAAGLLARIFAVMTVASITSSLLFNFTTNGNGELLRERMRGDHRRSRGAGRAACAASTWSGRSRRSRSGALIDRVSAEAALPRHRRAARCRCSRSRPSRDGWALLRADDRVHDRRVRRDSVHRRDDRPLRRRPDALARVRHAARRRVRRELARRVGAGPGRQGGWLRRAAVRDGRDRGGDVRGRRAAAAHARSAGATTATGVGPRRAPRAAR